MFREVERKSEITAIFNKYKDTFDNPIDSSDTKFPDQSKFLDRLEPIDKGTCNTSRSRGGLPSLLKENYLDENVLVMLLELAPKTQDSQVYKCHNVALFGPKSGRAQYKKGQKGGKNRKDKRGRENKRGKRDRGGHYRNKVNPMVGKSSGFETSIYYHIIYQYY